MAGQRNFLSLFLIADDREILYDYPAAARAGISIRLRIFFSFFSPLCGERGRASFGTRVRIHYAPSEPFLPPPTRPSLVTLSTKVSNPPRRDYPSFRVRTRRLFTGMNLRVGRIELRGSGWSEGDKQ